MVPNSSAETTFVMFFAKRCSLIASEAASISFDEVTLKASSLMVSAAAFPRPGGVSPENVTSRCTV